MLKEIKLEGDEKCNKIHFKSSKKLKENKIVLKNSKEYKEEELLDIKDGDCENKKHKNENKGKVVSKKKDFTLKDMNLIINPSPESTTNNDNNCTEKPNDNVDCDVDSSGINKKIIVKKKNKTNVHKYKKLQMPLLFDNTFIMRNPRHTCTQIYNYNFNLNSGASEKKEREKKIVILSTLKQSPINLEDYSNIKSLNKHQITKDKLKTNKSGIRKRKKHYTTEINVEDNAFYYSDFLKAINQYKLIDPNRIAKDKITEVDEENKIYENDFNESRDKDIIGEKLNKDTISRYSSLRRSKFSQNEKQSTNKEKSSINQLNVLEFSYDYSALPESSEIDIRDRKNIRLKTALHNKNSRYFKGIFNGNKYNYNKLNSNTTNSILDGQESSGYFQMNNQVSLRQKSNHSNNRKLSGKFRIPFRTNFSTQKIRKTSHFINNLEGSSKYFKFDHYLKSKFLQINHEEINLLGNRLRIFKDLEVDKEKDNELCINKIKSTINSSKKYEEHLNHFKNNRKIDSQINFTYINKCQNKKGFFCLF